MNIMECKYKAHRFINNIFYFIVFAIGFILGFTLNCFNVKAYTINDTINKISVDEDYIINAFSKNSDFNFENYSYFACLFRGSYNRCLAFRNDYVDYLRFGAFSSYNRGYGISPSLVPSNLDISSFDYFYFDTKKNFDDIVVYKVGFSKNGNFLANVPYMWNADDFKSFVKGMYTNYKLSYTNNHGLSSSDLANIESIHSSYNVLNFEKFKKLEMNDTLFDNDTNFKKVCVNSNDTFSITTDKSNMTDDEYNEYGYYIGSHHDFIWFMNDYYGIYTYIYDNYYENNVYIPKEGIYSNHDFYISNGAGFPFTDKEHIDFMFSDNDNLFEKKFSLFGYNVTDKYKYFGYTAYPFEYYYNQNEVVDENVENTFSHEWFNIFSFDTPKYFVPGSSCTEGTSGSSSDLDGSNKIYWKCVNGSILAFPEKSCFYIKKEYIVNILKKDNFNDDYGSVDTPWGKEDISTTLNFKNQDVNSSMFNVLTFLNEIKGTIMFINTNIYDFFNSMPVIVKMFILTFITILFVKMVIDMILR